MCDGITCAALGDLLEVTRRVMLPPERSGTFWCQEVSTSSMVEWVLSVRQESRNQAQGPTAVRGPKP
jgi:hypothetical protein